MLLTSCTFYKDSLKTPNACVKVGKVFFEPGEVSPSELVNSDLISAFCILVELINLINCLANNHFKPIFMKYLLDIY